MDNQGKIKLKALYSQIEKICRHFQAIRTEASGILENSQMPDTTLHLNDILKATEKAALTILDAAANISAITADPSLSTPIKDAISKEVGRIFEASGFQDLSGQRIKKVLSQLNALESQLQHLSDTAKSDVPVKQKDSLLNGPALIAEAPSQTDIDKLFNAN